MFSRICVYCSSSDEIPEPFRAAAREMGAAMVQAGIGLVFGGGRVGLMGTIADAVLAGGGEVIGVIPEKLQSRELGHTGCTELHVVDTMHTRKRMMMELSDAFIAMPGGYGTMEELFEATTWGQLNYHTKPVGLLNTRGFFDPIVQWTRNAVSEGFIRPAHAGLLTVAEHPADLLEALAQAEVPSIEGWLPPRVPDL
jgi:uncharacterized protein (TIGR00730 family)